MLLVHLTVAQRDADAGLPTGEAGKASGKEGSAPSLGESSAFGPVSS